MSLYLCVDCGGSKTAAAIADADGHILARALGGPSNFAYLGIDAFLLAVRDTVSRALQACTAPPSPTPVALPPPPATPLFAAAWLGVSGVDSPAAVAKLTPRVRALLGVPPAGGVTVCNDTALLAAPLQLHADVACAVACIAGTGGIVVSYTKDPQAPSGMREMGRVGGWGWILGDEGGGFHVGREAVRQMLMRADVASVEAAPPPRSVLEERVLARFGTEDVFDLLTAIHLPDPAPAPADGNSDAPADTDADADSDTPAYARMVREKRLSSLAPLVFSAAFASHDALALSVLHKTAGELADCVAILLRDDARAVRGVKAAEGVICFGGSLVGVPAYRDLVLEKLKERGHVFRRVEYIEDAAATGAMGLASAARMAREVA
ncbi:hypothetical protein EIP86_009293 [Pleurotus ostreatoroseus]|nr:hypothetical protein EIP86_009293 [Pleurotus ostreatoroseus]